MKRLISLLILFSLSTASFSHPWKPRHYVIIDTDAGIDDMKAISLLLASPDVRVVAVTVSPGALNANTAYLKIRSLLDSYFHEGVPVGINRTSAFKSPDFQTAFNTVWGDENRVNSRDAAESISLLKDILTVEKNKIEFLCLGSMSTLERLLAGQPSIKDVIKHVFWSNSGPGNKKDFNYSIDPEAAEKILKSDLPLTFVNNSSAFKLYDSKLISRITETNSVYAKELGQLLDNETVKRHDFVYMMADDAVPLLLHYPGVFTFRKAGNSDEALIADTVQAREMMLKILKGETVERNQVVKEFPADPAFYFSDIEASVTDIISKYGNDEWTSGVLANELHRHLGVFAIVGVKMGIRAREYFATGVDEFSVVSTAGSIPPLSCMNDGLQVSTGATPGHGLLKVINDSPAPSAEFSYLNQKIKLTLKPEITSLISNELKDINFVHGLDSDIYWELVRKNSIKYWLNLDRHEIFIIEKL
ncbi:MAG TPA: nucleoside hydrolase [Bacteroidales bacterium]|nr:nucleoside hydrolase [Bacteroidales bacterium]